MNRFRASPFLLALVIVAVVFFAMSPNEQAATANQQESTLLVPNDTGPNVIQHSFLNSTNLTEKNLTTASATSSCSMIAAAEHDGSYTNGCGACHRLNEIVAATNEMIPEPNLMTKTDLGVRETGNGKVFVMNGASVANPISPMFVSREVLRRTNPMIAMAANGAAGQYFV